MNLFSQPIEIENFSAGHRYECPVYYTLARGISKEGTLITIIWLPVKDDVDPSHWIKRGVALGCHTAN